MIEDTASAQLLARYGYLAILIGTMLEGETVVLVAGFLAHQGYLSLPWIIIFAIIGSCLSDQGLFFLARFRGAAFLARFPRLSQRVCVMAESMRSRVAALTAFALFFRFFYGLRNVSPLFLGLSSMPTPRFVLLNALGAVLWATVFSLTGYLLAKALQSLLGVLVRYEVLAALLLAALWGVFILCWRLRLGPIGMLRAKLPDLTECRTRNAEEKTPGEKAPDEKEPDENGRPPLPPPAP